MIYDTPRRNILLDDEGQLTITVQHRREHIQPVLKSYFPRDMLLLQINSEGSACCQEIALHEKRRDPTTMGRSSERHGAHFTEDND